ncbi:hypothetical protein [Clostridium tetani]|uniref:hypothetical protein n=1 Tax=Clostridium tetani TaxID=1513 RepID=UPI0024A8613D|nr:hypothetical protein [Clostridium tetani]
MKYTSNFNIPIHEDEDAYDIVTMMQGYEILDKKVPELVSSIFTSIKNITINKDNWKQVGNEYEYRFLDSSITDKMVAFVVFEKDSLFNSRFLYPVTKTETGKVILYSKKKPEKDLKCEIHLLREV